MGLVALTATVLSVELILGLGALLSRVPIAVDPNFLPSVIWHHRAGFQPQRNLFDYALWLALAMGVYACLRFGMSKFTKGRPNKDLKEFLIFHVLIVCLMGHAGFAVVAMDNPVWAWPLFWGSFAAGILVSIFWPEFLSGISFLKKYYAAMEMKPWVGNALACLFIFLVIFMPDLKAFVAMAYLGDYFHNWDYSLFGGVYAVAHGLIPCIDVNIPYGLGSTVMLAKMVNLMGGFEYDKLLGIAMWVGIIYFILWFFLLRQFLSSSLLAFAAIVCALRMHMFFVANDPCVWIGITHCFFRLFFDVGVLWMIWMHIQTRRMFFLAAGALFVSLALYYMLQTGLYIFSVFVLYVCASAFAPCLGGKRDWVHWRNSALILGGALVLTGLWFYFSVGTYLFTGPFLKNLVGVGSFYLKGGLISPLMSSITSNNVMFGIGGLLYPVFCMASFLYVVERVLAGTAQKRDVFAGLLAFYGLALHSYYILMVTDWIIFGLPGLFLLFYWIARLLEKAPAAWRKRLAWGLVMISLYCLMTPRSFTGYPNLLSFSRDPFVDSRTSFRVGPKLVPYFHQLMVDFPESIKLPVNSLGQKDEQLKYEKDFINDDALKAYYAQQTAWPEDTGLIRRLTPEGARVPVLSSFETLLLQRADRKPFFYYFPLINSRPLDIRNFMVTVGVNRYSQLQIVLDQLEDKKPQYIFMERIFLTPQVPQYYFYEYDDLIIVLRYIFSHYEPAEVGKYLVAMKRVK